MISPPAWRPGWSISAAPTPVSAGMAARSIRYRPNGGIFQRNGSDPITGRKYRYPITRYSACSASCSAAFSSTRSRSGVRWVTATTATYQHTVNGGQVRAAATRDRTAFFTQVCTGLRVACSSSVTGRPYTSSGGATMISSRCCTMCTAKTSS